MFHAQERAQQRYNKELTEKDMMNIQKSIIANQHTPLYSAPDDAKKKFCYLVYNHIPYKILYKMQKKQCRLITIYPFDVDEYNDIQEQKRKQKIEKAIEFLTREGYTVCKHS